VLRAYLQNGGQRQQEIIHALVGGQGDAMNDSSSVRTQTCRMTKAPDGVGTSKIAPVPALTFRVTVGDDRLMPARNPSALYE
jgi:hypothetical protein